MCTALEVLPAKANEKPCIDVPCAFQNEETFSSAKAVSSPASAFALA